MVEILFLTRLKNGRFTNFDYYLIQTKQNTLYICEVKFTRRTIRLEVIDEVKEKIKRLAIPKHFSARPVLIYVGALSDEILDADYFSYCLNLDDLFQ